MSGMADPLPPQPFYDRKVDRPRQAEPPIPGLNEGVLQRLLAAFEELRSAETSPFRHPGRAVLVTSPEAGYGKSHLVGRLMQTLSGQATLVYIRPFQTGDAYWCSLLDRVLAELHSPEDVQLESCPAGRPTQLTAFTCGILAQLTAYLLETGQMPHPDPQGAADYLRHDPVAAFDENEEPNWRQWLLSQLEPLLAHFNAVLRETPLSLHVPADAWLRVLIAQAFRSGEPYMPEICDEWLRGITIEPEEAKLLGLRRGAIPPEESALSERNELAKNRLFDLCQLSELYRPFLFLFDQTEVYGDHAALAAKFGLVISELSDQANHHLTVVTANLDPWSSRVEPHWERAYLDRLTRPFLELEGLNREQAVALVRNRLTQWEVANEAERMLSDDWLDGLFPSARNRMGVRRFLELCDDRWRKLRESKKPARTTLARSFERLCHEVQSQPRQFHFDADVLHWIVETLASGLENVTVEPYQHTRGYFRVMWKNENRRIVWGFEGGHHHKTWLAIANEALRHSTQARTKKLVAKCILLRTPELPIVPKKSWNEARETIEEACKAGALTIWQIKTSGVIQLYAAHRLYADVLQGDLPFSREETLAFLRGKLAKFWGKALELQKKAGNTGKAKPQSDTPDSAAIDQVREIVRQERFLSLEHLRKKIGDAVTEPQIFTACGQIPEIRVHAGPKHIVLQWLSSTSTSAS